MVRTIKPRNAERKKFRGGMDPSCVEGDEDAHEQRALALIEGNAQSWLKANAESIRSSSPEVCAEKSYIGGMFDMLMICRHALGLWGARQLVSQLERMSIGQPMPRSDSGEEGIHIRISSKGKSREEVVEEAKEIGMQIAKWVEGRNGKKKAKDPMFG